MRAAAPAQAADIVLDAVDAGPQPGCTVLHDFRIAIRGGEQVAVIGPSGAGKTTLLQVLALALAPSAGRVLHGTLDPWQQTTGRRQRARAAVFLAPQAPPLPPRQRVVTAVLAGRLAAMGTWRSLRSLIYPLDLELAAAALRRLDLEDKLFARVDRLSGGERQRVGLARGLVSPATLWLVDEPLSSLDPARARMVVEVLTAAARERGATLVVSFHQVDVALEHFGRVVGVRAGRLAFDRAPAAVRARDLEQLYGAAGAAWPAPVDGPAACHDT